ncbi:hypothetical protein BH23VER1_BH23VER1_11980 [soil metagenome]
MSAKVSSRPARARSDDLWQQVSEEPVDRDPLLRHGVALADGDEPFLFRTVFPDGVEVDGDAERGAGLVLTSV